METLLAAFERVRGGATELMLLSGSPGVGKSALVEQVQQAMRAKGAYFIRGKFDQLQQPVPYSAFRQAFNQFCDMLMLESEASFLVWQSYLLKMLGQNAQVLIDLIPNLEQLIGAQPALPEVTAKEAQNRFNLYFQRFIRTITNAAPLVIFIDDLQWADSASLNLLKRLLARSSPVFRVLTELAEAKTIINRIAVKNLQPQEIRALLADSLHCTQAKCDALAALLHQKTLGNPFFVSQFLHSLYEEGVLSFDIQKRQWRWQTSQLLELGISDNVVGLMASKIGKLSKATQNLLQLGACVGHRFDLNTLALIANQSVEQTMADLQPALQEGLLLPLSSTVKVVANATLPATGTAVPELVEGSTRPVGYQFVHDRIQQAAYSLIPDEQKEEIHWNIGRLLLKQACPSTATLNKMAKRVELTPQLDAHLFEIVNQLNIGLSHRSASLERAFYAHLNLLAGQKAKGAAAYQQAWQYLQTGLDSLKRVSNRLKTFIKKP